MTYTRVLLHSATCLLCAVHSQALAAAMPLAFVDNRPFVAVSVDGRGPFSFLLDTGSSSTTLSADTQRRLKLPVISDGSGGGAGEKRVVFQTVHAASVTVGPFSIGAVDAPAIDVAELSRVIGFQHFDGVLGAEIFQHNVLTLDAARNRLVIVAAGAFKPIAGAVAVAFTLDENEMPVVVASVAGQQGHFQIDTGDRSSLTLFGPFWQQLHLDRAMAPVVTAMTGYGIGGPILGIIGRTAGLSFGGMTIAKPVTRLSLQKNGSFTRKDRAGSIGMGVLRRFIVSFDYDRHTMWLAKGAAFDVPDVYDRSGLWLGLHAANDLAVVAVTPMSAADAGGLKAGDLVTHVGDMPAGPDTLSAIRSLLQSPRSVASEIRWLRSGRSYTQRITLRDQIARPTDGPDR